MATKAEDDLADRADRLYAARAAMAEAQPARRRLGVAEIIQFINDPKRSLTPDEQRSLFSDSRLRADYRRLKERAASFEMPALAAASSGNVSTRRFDGGTISIHPSRIAGQLYVILRFNSATDVPRAILLESAAGEILKRALPDADQQGEMMMVLNESNETDASFLRLLGDPTSTGTFVN